MSELSRPEHSSHQKAALLLREKLCDEFEQAIAAAEQPTLEDYLKEVGEEAQPILLRELLLIELHYLDRLGCGPDIDLYRKRFPLYCPLIEEVIRDKHLWQHPRIDSANTVIKAQCKPSLADHGRRMHIRCPHCHEAMDVATDAPLTGVVCEQCGSQFSLADDQLQQKPESLGSVAHYELRSRIGVGGFGTVWRAVDTQLDRVVAVKMPRSGHLEPRQELQLINEARAAAQLNHPNIVAVHEVGRWDNTIYIVSDMVVGDTLSDWIETYHPTRGECVEVCIKIAKALHHAHEAGVVHRDMKASNVLIGHDGEPKVTDFGLAKREMVETTIGEDGRVFGTPAYMSPEQARGEGHHADRRSDVYSLGVIFYQLLTEELPFRGNTPVLLHQVLNDEPPSPRQLDNSISRDLETICLKCLEKVPAKRYQTAREFADDLRRFQRGEPIISRPISRAERAWRWCRRHPMSAIAAALMAVIAVASPVIAIREHLHSLEVKKSNQEITTLIQRSTGWNLDDLQRQIAVSPELRGVRERWQVSPTGRKLMRFAFEQYQPAVEEILHSAATQEDRCLAILGLAILAKEIRPPDEAIEFLLKARDELELAASNSVDNPQLKAGLAFCYDTLAEFYGKSAQPAPAREFSKKAEQVWSRLAQAEPSLAIYRAMTDSQFNLLSLEGDAGRSNEELLNALDHPNEPSPQYLESFFPRNPKLLYETACELANCPRWLTNSDATAAGHTAPSAK